MAPFLVILLLLALGAGIVAWHTIDYPHAPAPRRRAPQQPEPEPDIPAATVTEPLYAPTPAPLASTSRTLDPFAHAPNFDMDQRS